jgi:hypothetical protein
MKKLICSAAVLLAVLSFGPAKAQLKVSLSLNIGTQPTWGPVGYDHAEYYYMPDIDCYYDVPHQQFVYRKGNAWVRATSLPAPYANYDLYSGYKVVVNEPTPYLHDDKNRVKYASYKGRHGQAVIRDSRDPKYTKYHQNNNHGHDNHDDHHNDHH